MHDKLENNNLSNLPMTTQALVRDHEEQNLTNDEYMDHANEPQQFMPAPSDLQNSNVDFQELINLKILINFIICLHTKGLGKKNS